MTLPPGAKWEEVTLRFIADGVILARFGGQTRRLEPEDLGMKNAKNGQPTFAWVWLKLLAKNRGRMPVHAADIGKTQGPQKHKQAVSKALRRAFGIAGEPIPAEGDDYVARFVISADDLDQGRQGQSERNFVEPD